MILLIPRDGSFELLDLTRVSSLVQEWASKSEWVTAYWRENQSPVSFSFGTELAKI